MIGRVEQKPADPAKYEVPVLAVLYSVKLEFGLSGLMPGLARSSMF